jgi:hypothetical protein
MLLDVRENAIALRLELSCFFQEMPTPEVQRLLYQFDRGMDYRTAPEPLLAVWSWRPIKKICELNGRDYADEARGMDRGEGFGAVGAKR